MNRLFKKLFVNGRWQIAYTKKGNCLIKDITSSELSYTALPNTKAYWFADPLLYSYGEKEFLFVEAYSYKHRKGEIGVFEFAENTLKYHHLIEEPFHMSFPYVFKWKDDFYMIPETSEARELRLYKATDFPYKWELDKVLIDGENIVDTVVYVSDDVCRLIAYNKDKNAVELYELDDLGNAIYISETKDVERVRRGAGNLFREDDKLFRATQVCHDVYGEYMIINECIMEETSFCETKYGEITVHNCHIDGENISKTHTLSVDDRYIVIDYYREFFDLFRIPRILLNRFARMQRKKYRERNRI